MCFSVVAWGGVLSSGKWARVRVSESGVMKITYEQLAEWGLDPQTAGVYGLGGTILPEVMPTTLPADLTPQAVYVQDGGDGVFGPGDYLLFYARGPVGWSQVSGSDGYTHTLNPYSDWGYYLVGGSRKIMETKSPVASPTSTVRAFRVVDVYENELSKPHNSGRKWFGETLEPNSEESFSFSVPGLITDSSLLVRVSAISKASQAATIKVTAASTTSSMTLSTYGSTSVASSLMRSFSASASSSDFDVNLLYTGSQSGVVQLDYIEVNAWARFSLHGNSYAVASVPQATASSVCKYVSDESVSVQVWNVAQADSVYAVTTSLVDGKVQWLDSVASPTYCLVNSDASFPSPVFVESVGNQDLRGTEAVNLVIVTHPDFWSQAQEVARLHRDSDGIKVLVCTPQQVYDEFNGGTPDATALRYLMRAQYDLDSSRELNLLLFGSGTYDNKGYKSQNTPYNKLLTYQSDNSVDNTIYSYVTDDFFGMIEAGSGGNVPSSRMAIGVGRFPVHTQSEADRMVQKVKAYRMRSSDDHWRQRLVFVADDDNDQNLCYTWQSDTLVKRVEKDNPEMQSLRLFTDSYTKVIGASSSSYPQVNAKLLSYLNQGVLLVNYLGHGSPEGLAAEKFFDRADIAALHNTRLPIFFTGTCDFAVYDSPSPSGGIELLLSQQGGAGLVISTSRTVYSNDNYLLARAFVSNLFVRDEQGRGRTIGQVLQSAKNALSGNTNKLSYALLGDPALRVPLPTKKVVIDEAPATISALSKVQLKGRVLDADNTLLRDFTGVLKLTVLDKATEQTTLGNASSGATTYTYTDRVSTLFSGKVQVDSGNWETSFMVPKDIDYTYGKGKVLLFAVENNGARYASGSNESVVVGGTDATAVFENNGPNVSLYLNSPFFKDGDKVDGTSILYATLSDINGINTTGSGLGHDLQVRLSGDTSCNISVNEYYENDFGTYQSGKLAFVLPTLSAGQYTLSLRAWDMLNNSTVQTIHFRVKEDNAPALYTVTPFPNPASRQDGVTFRIQHDQPETDQVFRLMVFDLAGNLMWKNEETLYSGTSQTDVRWNLRTYHGQPLMPGNYIYRLDVHTQGSDSSKAAGRLIVR